MKQPASRNVAASARQRLLNIAQRDGSDFAGLLTRYALERLLYRLGESRYRDQYVLKGAMLFHVWTEAAHRPTRDLDLLGRGDSSPEHCQTVFRELCGLPVTTDDGLIFLPESVGVEKIKEGLEYEGVRVKFVARLENARIAIQVDVGFGDAVMPSLLQYPTVLPMPAPQIQAYPMETVIAEKVLAISTPTALHVNICGWRNVLDCPLSARASHPSRCSSHRVSHFRRSGQTRHQGCDLLPVSTPFP